MIRLSRLDRKNPSWKDGPFLSQGKIVDYFEATPYSLAVSRCPLPLRRKKLYSSDSGDNVTSENYYGSYHIMPLPSSSRASVSKQSKEGSPLGVSLLTAEKASERFLRFRGIIFLIDVDALFLRQCLCCLLPNVGAFIRSDIHLASFRNVECLIEVRHRAKSASGAGFVWRMHVFFDL